MLQTGQQELTPAQRRRQEQQLQLRLLIGHAKALKALRLATCTLFQQLKSQLLDSSVLLSQHITQQALQFNNYQLIKLGSDLGSWHTLEELYRDLRHQQRFNLALLRLVTDVKTTPHKTLNILKLGSWLDLSQWNLSQRKQLLAKVRNIQTAEEVAQKLQQFSNEKYYESISKNLAAPFSHQNYLNYLSLPRTDVMFPHFYAHFKSHEAITNRTVAQLMLSMHSSLTSQHSILLSEQFKTKRLAIGHLNFSLTLQENQRILKAWGTRFQVDLDFLVRAYQVPSIFVKLGIDLAVLRRSWQGELINLYMLSVESASVSQEQFIVQFDKMPLFNKHLLIKAQYSKRLMIRNHMLKKCPVQTNLFRFVKNPDPSLFDLLRKRPDAKEVALLTPDFFPLALQFQNFTNFKLATIQNINKIRLSELLSYDFSAIRGAQAGKLGFLLNYLQSIKGQLSQRDIERVIPRLLKDQLFDTVRCLNERNSSKRKVRDVLENFLSKTREGKCCSKNSQLTEELLKRKQHQISKVVCYKVKNTVIIKFKKYNVDLVWVKSKMRLQSLSSITNSILLQDSSQLLAPYKQLLQNPLQVFKSALALGSSKCLQLIFSSLPEETKDRINFKRCLTQFKQDNTLDLPKQTDLLITATNLQAILRLNLSQQKVKVNLNVYSHLLEKRHFSLLSELGVEFSVQSLMQLNQQSWHLYHCRKESQVELVKRCLRRQNKEMSQNMFEFLQLKLIYPQLSIFYQKNFRLTEACTFDVKKAVCSLLKTNHYELAYALIKTKAIDWKQRTVEIFLNLIDQDKSHFFVDFLLPFVTKKLLVVHKKRIRSDCKDFSLQRTKSIIQHIQNQRRRIIYKARVFGAIVLHQDHSKFQLALEILREMPELVQSLPIQRLNRHWINSHFQINPFSDPTKQQLWLDSCTEMRVSSAANAIERSVQSERVLERIKKSRYSGRAVNNEFSQQLIQQVQSHQKDQLIKKMYLELCSDCTSFLARGRFAYKQARRRGPVRERAAVTKELILGSKDCVEELVCSFGRKRLLQKLKELDISLSQFKEHHKDKFEYVFRTNQDLQVREQQVVQEEVSPFVQRLLNYSFSDLLPLEKLSQFRREESFENLLFKVLCSRDQQLLKFQIKLLEEEDFILEKMFQNLDYKQCMHFRFSVIANWSLLVYALTLPEFYELFRNFRSSHALNQLKIICGTEGLPLYKDVDLFQVLSQKCISDQFIKELSDKCETLQRATQPNRFFKLLAPDQLAKAEEACRKFMRFGSKVGNSELVIQCLMTALKSQRGLTKINLYLSMAVSSLQIKKLLKRIRERCRNMSSVTLVFAEEDAVQLDAQSRQVTATLKPEFIKRKSLLVFNNSIQGLLDEQIAQIELQTPLPSKFHILRGTRLDELSPLQQFNLIQFQALYQPVHLHHHYQLNTINDPLSSPSFCSFLSSLGIKHSMRELYKAFSLSRPAYRVSLDQEQLDLVSVVEEYSQNYQLFCQQNKVIEETGISQDLQLHKKGWLELGFHGDQVRTKQGLIRTLLEHRSYIQQEMQFNYGIQLGLLLFELVSTLGLTDLKQFIAVLHEFKQRLVKIMMSQVLTVRTLRGLASKRIVVGFSGSGSNFSHCRRSIFQDYLYLQLSMS